MTGDRMDGGRIGHGEVNLNHEGEREGNEEKCRK